MRRWLVPVFCLLLSATVFAQTQTATLSGRVTDPSGAMLIGAKVTVTNTDTNIPTATKTNEAGVFIFPSLPAGPYRLMVQSQGFATLVHEGLVLHVQDRIEQNLALQVGSVDQRITITVSAESSGINTQDAAVSTVIDRQFVGNVPLNGRSFQALFQLTPGVTLSPVTGTSQGQFAINGQRPDANYFMVDGVSANIGVTFGVGPQEGTGGGLPVLSALGGTTPLSSVDALQEFRIQTSTFAPEFGRAPGGQVQIVTRSGTNQFHGTAFEYFRNGVLDANSWFSNYSGLPRPAEKTNDFGGVVGGPIIRNRTFFFFSYEGFRLHLPTPLSAFVPDSCLRGAGCSAAQTAAGIRPAVAALQPLLNGLPIANGPESSTLPGFAQFNVNVPNIYSTDSTSVRIDHKLNEKLALFGRYFESPSESIFRGLGGSANNIITISVNTRSATGGLTWVVTPSVLSDLHLNYSRSNAGSFFDLDTFGGAVVPPDSALLPGGQSFENSFASLVLGAPGAIIRKGTNADNIQRQINIIENVTISHGKHNIKFGLDYRRLTPRFGQRGYAVQGSFTGAGPSIQNNVLDLLSVNAFTPATFAYNSYALHGQDTLMIGSRLTLTYGLRWDVNPPPSTVTGPSPLAVTQVTDPSAFALAPSGTPIYGTRYGNVAPRVGLAYQLSRNPKWQSVIRGGYGIFYDAGTQQTALQYSGAPFFRVHASTNLSYPLPASSLTPAPLTLTPPFSSFVAYDPNFKAPRVQQWNATFQQALWSNQWLSVSYSGAVGRDLVEQMFLDTVTRSFSTGLVTLLTNGATSDYHSLQMQYKHQFSRGLQALASYGWGHSIDTVSSDGQVLLPARLIPPQSNRGSSDFDIRHAVSGSATYDLPVHINGAFGSILDGWGLDTIFNVRTALPIDIQTFDGLVNGLGGQIAVRPNVNPGVPFHLSGAACAAMGARVLGGAPACPGGMALNPAAFTTPSTPVPGNLGRNVVRGFPFYQWDLSLRRKFNLTERMNLTFRADAFNLLNHPLFGIPTSSNRENFLKISPTVANPRFGIATSTYANFIGQGGNAAVVPLFAQGSPRSLQLSLKLLF